MHVRLIAILLLSLLASFGVAQERYAVGTAVQITELELAATIASDFRPIVPTTLFKPADTVYLVVTTIGPVEGEPGSLGVAWRYGAEQSQQAVHSEGKELIFSGPGTTVFEVSKPDGWPTGDYSVEVFLNGKATKKLSYSVQ